MPLDEQGVLKAYLQALQKEQAKCIALLATPKEKSAFGYGEASGIYQGLHLAEQLFARVVGEAEDRD